MTPTKKSDKSEAQQVRKRAEKSTAAGSKKKESVKKKAKGPSKLRVVFAASEAVPFAKTGGLGDVAGSLPQALKAAGVDVRVVIPKYALIDGRYRSQFKPVATFETQLSWRQSYVGVEHMVLDGVDVYAIDNEYYFARGQLYGEFDDAERFAYFSKAVCEAIARVDELACDVLVCNDWQTALAPVYIRSCYPQLSQVKTVLAVHNVKFQGQYSDAIVGDVLGLMGNRDAEQALCIDDRSINFMKAGLLYADALVTVSPTYAEEIQYDFFGEGLDWLFRDRRDDLHGILNGIDVASWDPAHDSALAAPYTLEDRSGKALCKQALQRTCGLAQQADVPLIAMVGRLTAQKGLNLVAQSYERILATNAQLVVLGTGERRFEELFLWLERAYPGQVRSFITFDVALSRRIYAGADLFLMPSEFEPCGLSQMISMRYGTLPIVRETGGLKDTVRGYRGEDGAGFPCANGFSFPHIVADQLADAVERACGVYANEPSVWDKLVTCAMQGDFSWNQAAMRYRELFEQLVG